MTFADDETEAALDAGAETLRDTQRVVGAMCELLADAERRQRLHGAVERLMSGSDEVLGRWAPVMLNSAAYAEVIDRHVELYSRLAWVGSLLDHFEPTDGDPRRRRLSRSSPAVQLQGQFDDEWLSHNLVTIAQLAERLDRGTLQTRAAHRAAQVVADARRARPGEIRGRTRAPGASQRAGRAHRKPRVSSRRCAVVASHAPAPGHALAPSRACACVGVLLARGAIRLGLLGRGGLRLEREPHGLALT